MISIVSVEDISGVKILEHNCVQDSRGSFGKPLTLPKSAIKEEVSICYSFNLEKGTIRGLHLQRAPFGETKYIVCIKGSIYDVLIDLRTSSSTYLSAASVTLEENCSRTLVIPPGIAHGYQTTLDGTIVLYGIDGKYSEEFSERINPFDPELGIRWPFVVSKVSINDLNAQKLKAFLD